VYFEVGSHLGFSGKTKRKFQMTNGVGQNEKSEFEVYHILKNISLGKSCSSFKIFQPAVPEIFLIFPVKVGVVLENHQNFKVVKNGRVAHFWNPQSV
jgi:hypothetical protein